MTCSDTVDAEIVDQFDVKSPEGEQFRVLNMRGRPREGNPGTARFVAAQQRDAATGRWAALPLETVWFHWHFRSASVWPPEEALGAEWNDGMFTVIYESPWDPFAKAPVWPKKLDAHALWRARFNPLRQKWRLQRVRLYDENERARR
jgi:hypothetical protein